MLEGQKSQLVLGLQKLYCMMEEGRPWTGTQPRRSYQGTPLVNDILKELGVFEADPESSPRTSDHCAVDFSEVGGFSTHEDESEHDSRGHTPSSSPSEGSFQLDYFTLQHETLHGTSDQPRFVCSEAGLPTFGNLDDSESLSLNFQGLWPSQCPLEHSLDWRQELQVDPITLMLKMISDTRQV
jgi:hypothetical protein